MTPSISQGSLTTIDATSSSRIRTARVLCIFFVIYAHTYIGTPSPPVLSLDADSVINMIKLIIRDGFARVSVPLLGLISGYLAVGSYVGRGHQNLIGRKLKSLMYPVVLWSALMMVVYAAAGFGSNDIAFLEKEFPSDLLGWVNAFLAITHPPFNGPLHYLRDVFVCFLLMPVFYRLARDLPVVGIVIAAVLFFDGAGVRGLLQIGPFPLFFRPTIPALFLIGVLARMGYFAGLYPRFEKLLIANLWLVFAAVCVLAVYPSLNTSAPVDGSVAASNIHPLGRLVSLLLIWGMTIKIGQGVYSPAFAAASKATFLVFCMHPVFEFVARQFVGTLFAWDFPRYAGDLYYLLTPVACFAAGIVLWRIMEHRFPAALRVLSGDR